MTDVQRQVTLVDDRSIAGGVGDDRVAELVQDYVRVLIVIYASVTKRNSLRSRKVKRLRVARRSVRIDSDADFEQIFTPVVPNLAQIP